MNGAQSALARLALGVDLAQAGPLAQRLLLGHRDQVDALLRAQRLDQLLVVGLVAVVRQDGELRLAALRPLQRMMDMSAGIGSRN